MLSELSEFYDAMYETHFKCNKCGEIFTAAKKSQEICLQCMNDDLSKPSEEEMAQIMAEYLTADLADIFVYDDE